MLEVKDLHKYYRSSKGEDYHALKGLNLNFPKKGFVFIIGKSGSGKSTLLNVLGGLDRYDSGEILIKGKSSHSFKAKEWDSYRNTYLGFVFQDFNIIDSYSIGANIALALQLQGVKSSEALERTQEILNQVEAGDLINRKPNELSGGQRQRIAIARALVKNPEIIIADEPTGNLDSETSKVIMEILENLSKERLVIMVTHDLEYAEAYGERIIEMKDGEILSDTTKKTKSVIAPSATHHGKDPQVIELPKGESLSQNAIEAINALIKAHPEKAIYLTASTSSKAAELLKPAYKESSAKAASNAVPVELDYNYERNFQLIKSKLPFKNSFKMALSSIWSKKFKLLFASLLFIVSIGLFGFSRTVTRFDFPMAASLSYQEAGLERVFITKQEEILQPWGDTENVSSIFDYQDAMSLGAQTSLSLGHTYDFVQPISVRTGQSNALVEAQAIRGILEIDDLNAMNLRLSVGRVPESTDEVMITDYVADQLITTTYQSYLDGNPTLQLPYKTVDVVGILETDYADYTFLNNLNQTQLQGEQNAVLSFQNNDQILYSRLVVPKGFYAAYDDEVAFLLNYYSLNVYLESREANDEWPYEYLGESFMKINNDLLDSGYVALFNEGSSIPENGIILDVYSYARLLSVQNLISDENDLPFLREWNTTAAYKRDQLLAAGYGELTVPTVLNNRVNESWGDTEDSVIVGIIDFERYRQNALMPDIYIEALNAAEVDYIPKAQFERYAFLGYESYVESLRTLNIPSFPDMATYMAEENAETWEYYDAIRQALENADVVFIPEFSAYGYYLYLSDRLTEENIVFESFTQFEQREGNDPYRYIETLKSLLDQANEEFLAEDQFFETYLSNGNRYSDYLNRVVENESVAINPLYNDLYQATLLPASMYDAINPFTADKVHGLVVQLDANVDTNYAFFDGAETLGIAHLTPSGNILQIFEEFTSDADAIFAYVSLGFAGFAALLLFLNISQSILAKKKEIGTLRAMGARGGDVASIFINEATLLGIFAAFLAVVGITIATLQLNVFLSGQLGLELAIFNLSPVITLEMLGLTMVIVLLAAFIPVKRVSSMKPIDAIKNK